MKDFFLIGFLILWTLLIGLVMDIDRQNGRKIRQTGTINLLLKNIPIENITKVEIIKDTVPYVIIHHHKGMYSLSYENYKKLEDLIWG